MAVEYDSNGIPILSNKAYLSDTPSYTQALAQNLTDLVEIIVPIGMIQAVAGDTTSMLPYWLPCDGTIVPSDSRYDELRTRIGHTYGSEYRLPDLQGRTLIGAGQGAALTDRTLGQHVGNETRQLSRPEMPTHNHKGGSGATNVDLYHASGNGQEFGTHVDRQAAAGAGAPALDNAVVNTQWSAQDLNHTHTIPDDGDGLAHNNMQPSLVINYVILAARE